VTVSRPSRTPAVAITTDHDPPVRNFLVESMTPVASKRAERVKQVTTDAAFPASQVILSGRVDSPRLYCARVREGLPPA